MSHNALAAAALLIGTSLVAPFPRLDAQSRTQTVAGRVTSDSGAVRAAVVNVTMGPDRVTQTDTTDGDGRFALRFANGTGDYLVHIAAPGFRPFRRRVTQTPADSAIAVDAKLASEVQQLAAVRVQARRLKPTRGGEGLATETGASEKIADGVHGSVGPDREGDLLATAATLPGVTASGDGISVLGLGAGQSNATLNGVAFSGADLPRDARTRTRVSYSSYDPARGGFSGAQIATELSSGSLFSNRRGHVTVDAPFLQYTDAVSARLGQQYTNVQGSVGLDGMALGDRFAYNVAAQVAHRVSDLFSLGGADAEALGVAGVARDSAQRLLGILGARGIPAVASGIPSSRRTQSGSLIARIDHRPYVPNSFTPSGRTWGLVAYAKLSRSGALGIAPTTTPAYGGASRSATGMVQGLYSVFFGKESDWLNETRSALTVSRNDGDPYLLFPGGRVLVSSEITGLTPGIASLAFGGNSALGSDRTTWTWETVNETQKYVKGPHRVKMYAQSRLDGTRDAPGANRLGTFSFNSLADLEANRPSGYSRTLFSPDREGGQWSGALAAGDLWRKSPTFQLMYGARLEASRFTDAPSYNPAVERAFGERTDRAPNSVHVSPRLGFTWIYGGEKNNRTGYGVSNLGQFYFGPRGVVRGGIGEFRSLLPAALLADASINTGLAGGVRRVSCVGEATPLPDWDAYLSNPAAAPTECLSAGGAPAVFADTAPNVQLFDPRYAPPRSWRASLSWATQWKKLSISADALYSLNLDQPGTLDLNFAGAQRFTLADEGGRPVFVSPSSIVPATGAVSPVGARRSADFGRVVSHRSDLRSVSRQATVTVSPDFGFGRAVVSLAYTLADVRGRFRGFDGATFGSPLARERAPGDLDIRHQFTLQTGYGWKGYSFTLFGKVASGAPFTPVVGGDVNGDGLANDRAFVFDPAAADPAVAAGIRGLLAGAEPQARDCLERYLGRAAERNGCRGPWTATVNARIGLSNQLFRKLGNRVSASLSLANPLAGLDQLLHDDADLRGWGGPAFPDPVLYTVRGFDQATSRFRYEVNPRFGSTRPSRSTLRAPFRTTLDVSINWGVPATRQQIARTLNVGRKLPGARLTADSIAKRFARNVPSLYQMILRESDSLFLSRAQVEALQGADAKWKVKADSAWGVLATWLAGLPADYDAKEAERRTEETTDAVWNLAREEGPTIRSILSPAQLRLAPGTVTYVINEKGKIRIRYFSF